jgi:hypothetical protein
LTDAVKAAATVPEVPGSHGPPPTRALCCEGKMQEEPLAPGYDPKTSSLYPETDPRKIRAAIVRRLRLEAEYIDYILANNPPESEVDAWLRTKAKVEEAILCL